jgi:hypothetical protein
MPDSFGKRQRREVNAKKAAAREERRLDRAKRKQDRADGVLEAGPPLGDPFEAEPSEENEPNSDSSSSRTGG